MKSKRMSKGMGILILIITVLLIGGLGYISAFGIGERKAGAAEKIKLGLDLAGGVSITYQVAGGETPSDAVMDDTVSKLKDRAYVYSTEAVAYREGLNRITVEIPGVQDAEKIFADLGKPGTLEFKDADGNVVLTGADVKDAQARTQENELKNKENVVSLTLNDEGATKFGQATADNLNKTISIVFDDEVICAPTVNSVILDGQAIITGMESYERAQVLATSIRNGALQTELEELRSNIVGAKLGSEAIQTSLTAALIGIILVILIMIVIYRVPGFASGLALILYVILELIILNAYEITLTLPGIAGVILSIGMAVDANVIIFARIKEELTAGRTVENAIQTGFKKAMSAILDGNITTLIAAAVLMMFGTGSVKGFAQTLAIGILLSMFTALVITRFILKALFAVGLQSVKLYGVNKGRKTVDFLKRRKVFFTISAVIIIAGAAFMGINAGSGKDSLNYSLEFKGGTSTNVTLDKDYSIAEIDAQIVPKVEAITGGAIETQKVAGSNEVIIKTRELNQEERNALKSTLVNDFNADESLITTESISSTISSEMRTNAILAVALATVCMLIYIWIRFRDVRFAASAVIALLHDVLIVLAFYAFSRISVGGTFIACMLTIVGYSINATIVIFDRIREKLKESNAKTDLNELVNESITQTLSRSIYTSLTTFVTIAALYILGVTAIREFALPLIVGIIAGGYSSVCITGALWFVFKKIGKKK